MQRPAYRASEQDSAAVAAWRQQVYPALRRQAAQVGATVYFGDEAGVAAHHHAGTTWAPAGHTPVVAATACRARVDMVSAVEQRGRLHFQVTEGRSPPPASSSSAAGCWPTTTARVPGGGQLPHPPATAVTDYLAATERQLRLFFLPAYAPELNPDEWG